MASVVRRGAKFHVKFYYQGSQYCRSLKTTDPEDARHARAAVERTIHLLETGALRVPAGVDPVTFIAFQQPPEGETLLSNPVFCPNNGEHLTLPGFASASPRVRAVSLGRQGRRTLEVRRCQGWKKT